MIGQRVPDSLIKELRSNGTLRHVADHLAQDLIDGRKVHERVATDFLAVHGEMLTFMAKNNLCVSRNEGTEPALHCLRTILEWAQSMSDYNDNPDSERTT